MSFGVWISLLAFLSSAAFGANISRGFNQLLDSVVRIDVRQVAFDEGTRRLEASTSGPGSCFRPTAWS